MTFQDVLQDIAKNLVGKKLVSISGRSDITLTGVDFTAKEISLIASSGKSITRSFSELELIWSELVKKPAVHVDSTLEGAGSSRSHPETILANLPYVQWLRYRKHKHIALVTNSTRPYGQIAEMDSKLAAATTRALDRELERT